MSLFRGTPRAQQQQQAHLAFTALPLALWAGRRQELLSFSFQEINLALALSCCCVQWKSGQHSVERAFLLGQRSWRRLFVQERGFGPPKRTALRNHPLQNHLKSLVNTPYNIVKVYLRR